MSVDERLIQLGIELPAVPKPLGSYVPAVRSGGLLFLSGMLPLRDGKLIRTGIVGRDVTIEEAQACARQEVINALAVVKSSLGTLD